MKRLVFILAVLLCATSAFAGNRDFLLTADGSFYTATVEEASTHPDVRTASQSYIVVTEKSEGEKPQRHLIPATLDGGYNSDPALAYDADSETLFVFWRYTPYRMMSELRFASLDRDGRWSAPVAFDAAAYNIRKNLTVTVTTKAQKPGKDGEYTLEPEVNVHAFWWEESGDGERARYAMLTLEKGQVRLPIVARDLTSFLKNEAKQYEVEHDFNLDVLRFPNAVATPGRDSVEVIFGDTTTKGLHHLNLTPVGDARVRIPVGRRERPIAPPAHFNMKADGAISAIAPSDDRMALYFENEGAVKYLVWRDGKWSTVRSIDVDDAVTSQTAVEAIRRMVSSY